MSRPERDVLLVEDERNGDSIAGGLSDGGLSVDVASHRTAVAHLEASNYAVLIIDEVVPQKARLEFLHLLRARNPVQPPVVLLVTNTTHRDGLEGWAEVIHAVLKRPIDAGYVSDVVATCIDARKRLLAGAKPPT